jgi:hypothetical protein
VAENDLAVGRLVDAVSHSKDWKSTLILVVEDDAQNGPDHVDAHRTEALGISPYTQTGKVDSTHYDTASMIATAERVLNLPPMTIVDARVSPMWGSITNDPDYRAYNALQPTVVPFGDPGAPINGERADGRYRGALELPQGGPGPGDGPQPRDLEVGQGPALADAAPPPRPHHRLAPERRGRRLSFRAAGRAPRGGGAACGPCSPSA